MERQYVANYMYKHWLDVANHALNTSKNNGVRGAAQRVIEVVKSGGHAVIECNNDYSIILREWTK